MTGEWRLFAKNNRSYSVQSTMSIPEDYSDKTCESAGGRSDVWRANWALDIESKFGMLLIAIRAWSRLNRRLVNDSKVLSPSWILKGLKSKLNASWNWINQRLLGEWKPNSSDELICHLTAKYLHFNYAARWRCGRVWNSSNWNRCSFAADCRAPKYSQIYGRAN